MKVPSINVSAVRAATSLAIVCFGAMLGGCVSYGNTHALLTPIGVVGYHSFKPPGVEQVRPPELKIPDRVAATPQPQQPSEDQQNET